MRVRSIADVSSAVRGRRMDLKLSQSALAARTGVSRKWISEFESGKPTAEVSLVMRVLEGLGLELEIDVARTQAPHTQVDLDALLDQYRSG